jgi:ABC-type Fe3+/spermidine/putrescine transport system ATPase subunit
VSTVVAAPVPDLQLQGLTKRYAGTVAVDDVSLDVAPGEFVTLLGPSGCGKTTLLKSIAGFLDPNGVLPHLRNIGIVFQHYALFPHMTAAENVGFGLRMRRIPRPEIARRVGEMLQLVKLPGLGARYPHQLSGGQQQRVALARVLAIQPVLLLLDEPFGALDKKLRVEMQIEVKQLVEALGMTTIFVTHDQEEAIRMSDRIAIMHRGRIVQCDSPEAIYDRPADLFVADFIGASNLLEAKVIGAGPSGVRLHVAGSEICVAPATARPGTVDRGPDAIVMIRPENLSLAGGGASTSPSAEARGDGGAWKGRVSFALHAGPTMEYEVVLGGGQRLRVSRPRLGAGATAARRVGDEVAVSVIDPTACRVFARPG